MSSNNNYPNNDAIVTTTTTKIDSSSPIMNTIKTTSSSHNNDDDDDDNNNNENNNNDEMIVPQLQHDNITFQELQITVRVLNAIGSLTKRKSNKKCYDSNITKNQQKKQQQHGNKKKRKKSDEDDNDNHDITSEKQELDTEKQKDDDEEEKKNGIDDNDIDPLLLYKHVNLRTLRKALAQCMELHRRSMFNGLEEEQYYQERIQNRTLKRQKLAETDLQRKFIQSTILRKGRIDKLNQLTLKQQEHEDVLEQQQVLLLQDDAHHDNDNNAQDHDADGSNDNDQKIDKKKQQIMVEYMIPDGHVETDAAITANIDPMTGSATDTNVNTTITNNVVLLPKLRSCYVCKQRYRELNVFYDQLCPSCATLNWTKRHQSVDLSNKIAIVTGSRVKIGYQTCLKLLRAGCTVIATTRFPNTAIEAYRHEKDFDSFHDRLHIYGLDLRDVTGLEAFTRYISMKYSNVGIDILINNACQTVRRPISYYIPIVHNEQSIYTNSDHIHKSLLNGCYQFESIRRQILLSDHNNNNQKQSQSSTTTGLLMSNAPMLLLDTPSSLNDDDIATDPIAINEDKKDTDTIIVKEPAVDSGTIISTNNGNNEQHNDDGDHSNTTNINTSSSIFERTGLTHSTAMSQMMIIPEDVGVHDNILPNIHDVNGQPLDLRTRNSWLLKMDEVSTPELMECMLINAIAPFVLNSRLKPVMTTPNDDSRPDRYIINVSAMEGKFYRYKTECHPHTNMAKAALNMLTRTSADELAKNHRIYMNSVDTGWINDENPLNKASQIAKNNQFQTPIDEIDAAARILDPIFTGIMNDENNHLNNMNSSNIEKTTPCSDVDGTNNGGGSGADGHYEKLYGKFLKDYKESEW